MCAELEDNPIDSQECKKCEVVSHDLFPNNVSALFLQRDITHITIYCGQYCMVSMDQATLMDGNEEVL